MVVQHQSYWLSTWWAEVGVPVAFASVTMKTSTAAVPCTMIASAAAVAVVAAVGADATGSHYSLATVAGW